MQTRYFRTGLLEWDKALNTRQMPWKGEKDPYRIWLSEVILQQTRVEQGLAYYERFVDFFPKIEDLAMAPEEQVFKLWEGLGYYSRCKNLIHTARFIAEEKNGQFPHLFEEIIALKGIGPYTAAAIASFAFGLPHAVVDGNVLRVLSRFFGIRVPVDTTEGKTILTELAEKCLDRDLPGAYNQALMDFGAMVCKPANPLCETCPLQERCLALKNGETGLLPIKSKKLVRKDRYLLYVVAEWKDGLYVRKRTGKDIWQNLFECILHELTSDKEWVDFGRLMNQPWFRNVVGKAPYTVLGMTPVYRQLLTHQHVQARFLRIRLEEPLKAPGEYRLVSREELGKLAFPRLLNDFLASTGTVEITSLRQEGK